jgi:hypothetical protein
MGESKMDKKPLLGKWLAIGIILLFVGVTIAPTINFQVVKASTDNDLVEVTTQACGIKGYRDTTVKLTREQVNEIDLLFESINNKLNNATSKEESVRIFQNAIIELDKYGLLPRGMNIEQAQRLVTEWNRNHKDSVLNTKLRHVFSPLYIDEMCLIAIIATPVAQDSQIIFLGLLSLISKFLLNFPYLYTLDIYFYYFFPLRFMNTIYIIDYDSVYHSVSKEWITDGHGVSLLWGYTGLILNFINHKTYFLGFVLGYE